MNRRFLTTTFGAVLVLGALFLIGAINLQSVAAQTVTQYESRPDQAALYLGDLAYLRDVVSLPADQEVCVVLPSTTLSQSLIITENGERVQSYRYVSSGTAPEAMPLFNAMGAPSSVSSSGQPLIIMWDPPGGEGEREIVLEYLATGASWQPVYDMTVLDDEQVLFGFDAEVRNTALPIDGAEILLVAGMPGADPNYQPDMTMTQSNVGYFGVDAAAPAIGGAVQVQHVYRIGEQPIMPGEVLRLNLVNETLGARRLLVWDARYGQRVDVIYKVQNTTDVPFVTGTVRAYEDGLYVGDDAIEWTPTGSEGSVTMAGLSDIRVRRTESVEVIGGFARDTDHFHEVELSISNHSDEDLDLIVLDEWNQYGIDFSFSHEPERQGNNVLRWELTIPAGEQVLVEYSFTRD